MAGYVSTFETEQRVVEDALAACPTTGQSDERVMQPLKKAAMRRDGWPQP